MQKDEKFCVPPALLKQILANPKDKANVEKLAKAKRQRKKFPFYIATV